MTTRIRLFTICHHTKLTFRIYSLGDWKVCCTTLLNRVSMRDIIPHGLFYRWKLCLLTPFTRFTHSLVFLFSSNSHSALYSSDFCFVLLCSFVLFFRFHIQMKSYSTRLMSPCVNPLRVHPQHRDTLQSIIPWRPADVLRLTNESLLYSLDAFQTKAFALGHLMTETTRELFKRSILVHSIPLYALDVDPAGFLNRTFGDSGPSPTGSGAWCGAGAVC